MDSFPYMDGGLENDLLPRCKPVETVYRIGLTWNADGAIYDVIAV